MTRVPLDSMSRIARRSWISVANRGPRKRGYFGVARFGLEYAGAVRKEV